MNDHDTDRRLRSWVHSSVDLSAPADLRRQILDIPNAEPTTQRRRWIRLLPGRKPTAGAAPPDEHTQQPHSSNKTNGGARTMLSATKMIGLAAVLAFLGGLTLALPIGAPETAPDPAVTDIDTGEISWFSGNIDVLDQDVMADAEHFDWGAVKHGEQWTLRWEMSDPRISGITTLFQNVYEFGPEKRRVFAHTGRLFTKVEDGTWLETGQAYQDPETTGLHLQIQSVGEGAYKGLFALSNCGQETYSGRMACEGVIFAGNPPEPPSDPPSEIPAIHLEP